MPFGKRHESIYSPPPPRDKTVVQLSLVRQQVLEKENSELKPVELHDAGAYGVAAITIGNGLSYPSSNPE